MAKITNTFREECIIKHLWNCDELENQTLENFININLNDEALKLFMRNNFENLTDKQNIKSYYDENVFENVPSIYNSNSKTLTDTIVEEITKDEKYDLNSYIRINSNLISDINDFNNKLKTLNIDQTDVMNYIKKNLGNQMLIFLSGEGGCGKTYLLNIINNMMTMNGLTVRKLATTGYAATLIDGQTVHGFFSINYLLKCTLQYDSSKWHTLRETDVFIIDECSLMSDELLNLIEEVLSRIYHDVMKKDAIRYKFGKKTIILVGDLLQLAAISTFNRPITQLYQSNFLENFLPFILQNNMRAIEDPAYSEFLSKCRVGEYDFDYIVGRICGKGHDYTDDCKNMMDSVNICSLHKNRKENIIKTLDTYFPNPERVVINSVDTNEDGSLVSESVTKKITETSGYFEENLILTKGCKIILIKNVNIELKIVMVLMANTSIIQITYY